jgi:glycosyltransferase involved in cell wall biosynthesis
MKLVFLGQGELEKDLKKVVEELKIEKEVYFLGFQKNPFKFISNSKMFVFSSLYEGFPNALVEAMACEIPVISSDCKSGPREILAPETDLKIETRTIEYAKYGILIPVCDGNYYDAQFPLTTEEMVMAKSIVDLYSSKELLENYIRKAKERVKDFDRGKIILEYDNILK